MILILIIIWNGRQMEDSITSVLRKYFPEIGKLYPYQDVALKNLLNKRNTLSIVPTGGGKSLIFQLSSLMQKGLTIVVSPLLALMHEQVALLNSKKINAISINSDLSFIEQRDYLRNISENSPKIMYVSPERLQNYFFKLAIAKSTLPIPLIAIDEAHCISQWGTEFRPEYTQIKSFVNFLRENGKTPNIFALTATLSKLPREDIKKEFQIEDTSEFINGDVIRDNLILNFTEVVKEDDKYIEVINFMEKHNSKKTIIYLYNRLQCEDLSSKLNGENINSDFFHSNMTPERKIDIYNEFKNNQIKVLVSTTAFGMGMNIPDIDTIIQYHLPSSLEEYYQQVGRAARDKNICPTANCLALWSERNFTVKKRRIKNESAYKIEELEKAFEFFDLYKELGQISSIDYSTYKTSNLNLPLIKYYFEKYRIFEFIGEINGYPNKIRFKNKNNFWDKIMDASDSSFIIASYKSEIDIEEIINTVHTEDWKGNIEYLPAMDKILYMKTNFPKPPLDLFKNIIEDININVDFRVHQIDILEKLYKLNDQEEIKKFIAHSLGVRFN